MKTVCLLYKDAFRKTAKQTSGSRTEDMKKYKYIELTGGRIS